MTAVPNSQLFDLTRQVVEEAERRVLNFKSQGALADKATRNGLFPFSFLKLGIWELMLPLFKWAIPSSLLLLATTLLLPEANISPDAKFYIFLFCTYVPLFLVIFAVPSTFAFDSISSAQIGGLADFIFARGFDTVDKLESLGECISFVSERTYARTKSYQRIVAVVWGLLLIGINQFSSTALKFAPEHSLKFFLDNLFTLFLYGAVSFLSLVVILGYKKANDAVFRRLLFSVEELKYRTAQTKPPS